MILVNELEPTTLIIV